MKAVILCGGVGTRLTEETTVKPKPMVEIGGRPILWHIMKHYAAHGVREFVLTLGYKGEVIKDYFVNYHHRFRSLTVSLKDGTFRAHEKAREEWIVHLLDTGQNTQTGGRVKRAAQFVGKETFLLTYGDGVSNVDIRELIKFHKKHKKQATVTAVRPPSRFGGIAFNGDRVTRFVEKPQIAEGWINGGFFVLEPSVCDLVQDDTIVWEREPMEALAAKGELMAYRHSGFWQCMDTMRDVNLLEGLWQKGSAPWKVWED